MYDQRAVRTRVRDIVAGKELSGLARETAERELRNAEIVTHLALAAHRCKLAEDLIGQDRFNSEHAALLDAQEALTTALEGTADDIIDSHMETRLYGVEVDLTLSTHLECPVCNECDFVDRDGNPTTLEAEAFALGPITTSSVDHAAGWLCRKCGSQLKECFQDGEQVALTVIERGRDAPEPADTPE